MEKSDYIRWFEQLGIEDVPLVGGKNASLGEMYRNLSKKGVSIPNGFAITAKAYFYLLEHAGIKDQVKNTLKDLNTNDINNLRKRGNLVRKLIRQASMPKDLEKQITSNYNMLCKLYKTKAVDVAVRSSATAEDLPDASFAGQQETYLNIRGTTALIKACMKCFASLFTDRAISYRVDKGFDHFSIGLSIAVQKMVRADKACSGVMFSIDTESGFKEVVFITGSYGLGENIVQGTVNPDEYYVFKPTLKKGYNAIIAKEVGSKKVKMIYTKSHGFPTKNINVPPRDQTKFVLTENEILKLAKWACIIEEHYSAKAKSYKPMDMEWAKDGLTNQLFIVQARPETVHSQKDTQVLQKYVLRQHGKVLVKGRSVGEKIGQGKSHIIMNVRDIDKFKKGEVLVTDMTDPDWEPILKIASAVVTDKGGRTCFAGDTLVLTSKGFMTFEEIFKDYEDLYVPSLNRDTLKVEWKPVLAAMKRQSKVIEVQVSQTGNMKNNSLKLTPDHQMLSFFNRKLEAKEIADLVHDKEMVLIAHNLPALAESNEKERKLAYLLGAISTDGHVYLTSSHGEVQFIQKPTKAKQEFIKKVNDCMKSVYNKPFKTSLKKISSGVIRENRVVGTANAYRCYSKTIAQDIKNEQQAIVKTLLTADKELILNYLGGVIDGDGSFNHSSNRINIYCSKKPLLQSIVVSCLRLGICPQITQNRTIWNVQIVEKVDQVLKYTKRVKGNYSRNVQGTRFFSAKQLLGDIIDSVNYKGGVKTYVQNNLLIDADKIQNAITPMCQNQIKTDLSKILNSDTRMQRVSFSGLKGLQDVYNITVADNHNYLVFSERFTPIIVNNCHAAIVSRELGIPCIVGTITGSNDIKTGKDVTVDCSEGSEGIVYEGKLKFDIIEHDLKKLPKSKTKIMMNLGNPEQAFELSHLPNQGVGLAREEFIINSYIKIHPLALLHYKKLGNKKVKQQIAGLTVGYDDKGQFFVDKLAYGIAKIAAAFHPHDVVVRLSDFKSNEYANLIGGKEFEPIEDNPMIGWRGASRYYDDNYKEAFGLECKAFLKVRNEMGLTNVVVMIPFCRTVDEGKRVLKVMAENGLKQGKNGLRVYVMCEIPSNVLLAEQFLEIFDGFSIGSNDLTQLTLGLDRDSELVAHIYDERNEAVKALIEHVIKIARKKKKHMGFCGDAPSSIPGYAEFLVKCGIESLSVTSDAVVKTLLNVIETEKKK